ncbi:MAG TPA: YggS family pyridoxal phosphate enzyme [Thermoleophilaceae bacterium]|nr:YggS family pyridoxal phosphate enzyme [Thermoleophilaceae bacterium]
MTTQFTNLRPERIRENLDRVCDRIVSAGREPTEVEILAAIKYVGAEELPALAEGGVRLVGENRAQELVAKRHAYAGDFTWDFIGALQSRKVRDIAPCVRLIHSVASESALRELAKHPVPEVLIEVNVAGEESKAGIEPAELPHYLETCPVPVTGLMCMPPFTEKPEDSRSHFARVAELAAEHGLRRLSMGTSQDYGVALEEGATIIRLGSVLYE